MEVTKDLMPFLFLCTNEFKIDIIELSSKQVYKSKSIHRKEENQL